MMALSFLYVYYGKTQGNIDKIDTLTISDTIYKDTVLTIIKEKPIPKEVYLTKIDTFYTNNGKDTLLKTENKVYNDTIACAKDTVVVTNFIKGINATLDSTKVLLKKQDKIITNTVTIEKYIEKKKTFFSRFHVGIQTGYGYGFNSRQFEPYVGAGLSIDIN